MSIAYGLLPPGYTLPVICTDPVLVTPNELAG